MGAKINRTHSFSFQSQHNRELQQTWWQVAVTKTWQPIFPRLFSWRVQEPNSCLECMCVCEECVYSVPAVKNSIVSLCSPMLMWLGSVGADVALVVFEQHGSFVCKSDGAAERSFNFSFVFFKKTLRNSRLCPKADCVYPCTKTHRCAWYETPTDLTKPYLDTLDD